MSRVLIDSLTHAYAKCEKPSFWIISNDHLISKSISYVYKPKVFWMIHHNNQLYSKSMRLFVGSGFLVSHCGLLKPIHFYGLSPLGTMSYHNWRVIHPMGDLSILADTRHIFSISCNRATLLNVVPFTELSQSNTKRCVNLPIMHSHPTQCDAPVHIQCKMSLHVSSCYMYNILHGTIYKPYFMPSTMDNYIKSI